MNMATIAMSEDQHIFTHDNKEINMRKSAITAERLSRFFNFAVNSVYIKEEFGTRVEFPNSNGKFNLAPFSDGTSFEVYGDGTFSDDVQVANQTAGTSSTFASISTLAKRPLGSTNTSAVIKQQGKSKATVKVILAELDSHGKIVPNTKNAKQTFVPLYTDEQANVTYITAFVNSSMGESDLKLVGNNGISYSDEPGTRGIEFWKKGSRKVFAVKIMTKTRKTKRPSFDDSDESDFEGNYSNKQRKANWDIESQLSDMEGKLIQIEMRVDETRSDINKVISLTKDSHVPLAIKNIVQESFSCLICKTAPMNTPVIGVVVP
ncbi:hypothetical protein QZH41_010064 [Actinostola sp. cb2023]|nr:hypothetical protein QZH41_010064 [Actinostola sp. cb2023]